MVGAGGCGRGNGCLLRVEVQFGEIKSSGDGWWCWLHHDVNVLKMLLNRALKNGKHCVMGILANKKT